jgi:elongation factor G
MREYKSQDIRNIAVVGHGASGKTTLVDALAFVSGASKRHGSVRDGNALTDFDPEETARGFSIGLACAHAEWMDTKINLLDTPGYSDFQGEAIAGLTAADGALIVVSATAGVEVGTTRMFNEAIDRKDPVLFVASMIDKEHASFDGVFSGIKSSLNNGVIPVEVPIGEGPEFHGILNLFDKKAHIFKHGTKSGEYDEIDVPAEHQALFDKYYEQLIEGIAATDDVLLEKYLGGEQIDRADALNAMKEAMKRQELFPLFCCSSDLTYGTQALLTKIVELMPSAFEMEELHAFVGAEGDRTVEIHADDKGPFVAQVFKTHSEPHVGDVSFFRIFSGTLTSGQEVYNATRGHSEKMVHLAIPQGKDRIEVPMLHPGDIGCVAKLKNSHTNDTLSTREHPVRLPEIAFPEPRVVYAVHATARGEVEKLQQGLHRLHDEDACFQTHYNAETHETIVAGLGERHLDVVMARLKRHYGVTGDLRKPQIAYRETIVGKAEGQGRHKKQSGGKGQFGDCWVRMAPTPRGSGYSFVNAVVGGSIPSKFIPAVDRGVQEASARGVLAGYPMVDFMCEVFDGSYHSVDSNEMSFKLAGILAFKTVAQKCKPILLEPLDEIDVTTPDLYLGDVLGDISARRGHILGTDTLPGGKSRVRAVVPQGEMHLYATDLFSKTHGHGTFVQRFKGYEQMPPDATQRIIAENRGMKEAVGE